MTEEELFHAALAKPSAERAGFLEQACSGNAPLRAAVEALLAAHEAPGSLLNLPPNPPAANPSEGDLLRISFTPPLGDSARLTDWW